VHVKAFTFLLTGVAAAGFLYDSSIPEPFPTATSPSGNDRLWPYTMDYGLPQRCDLGTGAYTHLLVTATLQALLGIKFLSALLAFLSLLHCCAPVLACLAGSLASPIASRPI
jgi:hypothetical protein